MLRESLNEGTGKEPIVTGNYQHEELKRLREKANSKIEFLLYGRMQGNLGRPAVSDDVIYNKVFMDVFEGLQKSTSEDSPLITKIFSEYFWDNFGLEVSSEDLAKRISNDYFWENFGLDVKKDIPNNEDINPKTFYSVLESMIKPHVEKAGLSQNYLKKNPKHPPLYKADY